jgi:hypothetical protein
MAASMRGIGQLPSAQLASRSGLDNDDLRGWWAKRKTHTIAEDMTVLLTVFASFAAAMRRGYWLVTPFNNMARYVERMMSAPAV